MKPDGVATAPSEPMEAEEMGPVAEPTGNEGVSHNGTMPSLPQPYEPPNQQEAPSTGKASGKGVDPKGKSKGPVKGKTTIGGPVTTGPGTRPKVTQSRVANGIPKTVASTTTKKPIPATAATAEKKPTNAIGATAPSKKPAGPSTAVTTSRAQSKVTTVGTSRTMTTTTTATSGTKTAVSTATSLSRRPATASTTAPTKPKTTAPPPRLATAKPSTSATAKTTTAPKTNRTTGSTAPRPAATSAIGRTTTSTTTTAVRSRTAAPQPVKPLVVASTARKDAGKTATTAPAKKPVALKTTRPPSKPSNSEAPKLAATTKQPLPSIKAPQSKPDDKKSVPTRKVPPSPRNTSSQSTSGKNTAASPSHRQTGSTTTVTGKLQPTKPTQSVVPLVVNKKPADKEPAAGSVQLSAAAVATVAVATAAAITTEESFLGPEATAALDGSLDTQASSSLDVQENTDVQVLNTNANTEPLTQETLVEAGSIELSDPTASAVIQEFEEHGLEAVDEKLTAAVLQQINITTSPFDNPPATLVPTVGLEVADKAECYEDVEEEEEGSQQVSLSEMSGTQPTEESQPGSAGLPGSIWRAGAMLSELDSEDVSCSQQGASELSAPGVLEGTESMDDLGDASLKGADGEGVSVGSPDFEKVSDILNNEDEDYDDRVCDMEVGSERAEDSHGQHHDNEDDDDDVEMVSEGITESGLESYGNADEDDLTDDYRLDNLNRIQPPPMDVSNPLATQWNQSSCFADPWAQLPQPASALLASPSSDHWQADPETPTQAPAQATMDGSNSKRGPPSPYFQNLIDPPLCSPAGGDVCPKPGPTPPQACESQSQLIGTLSGSEVLSDTSLPEEGKDYSSCLGTKILCTGDLQLESLNPGLPDIMQDLGLDLECADEEEPGTLPADDVLGGPATAPVSAPSSSSSATEDEASDTEGEMQISDPQAELLVTGNTCGTAPVAHSLSTLEEREEIAGETEGGGGSDTPQSATSAASYGFDNTTSNSNAQSSAESCSKSPGIFSLENEEQLPDEAKDPSLLEELTLIPPAGEEKIETVKSQHGKVQPHPEKQYMLCGATGQLPESDLLPEAAPLESGLIDCSSPQQPEEQQGLDTQHPYYSICENTDSSLSACKPSPFSLNSSPSKGGKTRSDPINLLDLNPYQEKNSHMTSQLQDLLHIQMAMSSKRRLRPRASHVNQPPRLPTDLPPRIPSVGSNAQLLHLDKHQQHIQQLQEKRNREEERREEAREKQVRNDREEEELEKQRRNLLELQLGQQEQELKQRQEIVQQKKHKVHTPVLSPSSGLCTIYESLETRDSEEEKQEAVEEPEKAEDKSTFIICPDEETQRRPEEKDQDDFHLHCSTALLEETDQDPHKDHEETGTATDQDSPSQSSSGPPERPTPLEFDWGKKVDIVQHLINQTLLLTGDSCSPLLLLPGGAGGKLSPLENNLWPNLLPPLTPSSGTVTSVSSFSPEAPGSSARGEWTVVELETHH